MRPADRRVEFPLVHEVAEFFQDLPANWCMAGGWALDLYQDRVTRKHLDVDVCVFTSNREECVRFFINRNWRVEGKQGNGFVHVTDASEWHDEMPYFWAVVQNADFLPSYINDRGDRKFHYLHNEQRSMDFIEVYFPYVEEGALVYEENHRIQRSLNQAVRQNYGVNYLAPEFVLLHKANWPKAKDLDDLQRIWPSMSGEQQDWLIKALRTIQPTHPWFDEAPLHGF